MSEFKDCLGSQLRVGDLVVVGFKEGNSTPSVGIMKVVELMPKDRWEARVKIVDPSDENTSYHIYRYCDRVMRLDALAVEADRILEQQK